MYQWKREDVARVAMGLVVGVPVIAALALRAFGEGGSPLLQVLVVTAILADAALALKMVQVHRAFAREDREWAGRGNG